MVLPDRPMVLVGMSGGVDSSVAAAFLVQQGYRVFGLMLRLWQMEGVDCDNKCCTNESMDLAKNVAAQLNIPFYVMDCRERFKSSVVNYFIESSRQGLTPNPCHFCNQNFRWDALLNYADALGAEMIATGHYARIERFPGGRVSLFRGLDESKDQSYVLSGLNQVQLSRTLLPLADLQKVEVRREALRLGLPVASRPDSQDLCFLGDSDPRNFFSLYAPECLSPGDIVTREGKIIGSHNGLGLYTIGQRKGLRISADHPLYVISKVNESNTLIVGDAGTLEASRMKVHDLSWISGSPPGSEFISQVKIRYKAHPVSARVAVDGYGQAEVKFDSPLRDITPGQVAVFYQGEQCLGCGSITSGMMDSEVEDL